MLSLVRGLIAFGQALIQTLQASPAAEMLSAITSRFGTRDLALIVARITRGLMLAADLDARLARDASRLDAPPPRPAAARTAERRTRRVPVPPLPQQEDDAALLARLPTAEEIAAQVRGKPIGVVLEAICQDLGITCEHPLWRELHKAILANGGSFDRVFANMLYRVNAGYGPSPDLSAATRHPQPQPQPQPQPHPDPHPHRQPHPDPHRQSQAQPQPQPQPHPRPDPSAQCFAPAAAGPS